MQRSVFHPVAHPVLEARKRFVEEVEGHLQIPLHRSSGTRSVLGMVALLVTLLHFVHVLDVVAIIAYVLCVLHTCTVCEFISVKIERIM